MFDFMMVLAAAAETIPAEEGWTVAKIIDYAIKAFMAIGGIGGITAFFLVKVQKRKTLAESTRTDAEADSIVADAQNKRTDRESRILDMYEKSAAYMQEQLEDANNKIDRLTVYVEILVQAMRDSGTKVPPMPPRTPTVHKEREPA
ncbi:MAG: hypothetical protein JWQ03_3179 [Variovorax sp.]|nr:hypothetical protein [Variovorax sp.]